MSKTIEDVGMIVGGLALAVFAAPLAGALFYDSFATAFYSMVGIGVTTALAGGMGLLIPGPPTGVTVGQQSINQPAAYRRVIYGHFTCAGVPTFAGRDNGDVNTGQTLHIVYTLTGHKITGFESLDLTGHTSQTGGAYCVLVDGTPISLQYDGVHNVWIPLSSDPYYGFLYFEFDIGDPSSSSQPFPDLVSHSVGWTSSFLQRGRAKVHVAMMYSQNEINSPPTGAFPYYTGGRVPNFQFRVVGKPLTDVRLTNDRWQANTFYPVFTTIVDPNGYIQSANSAGGGGEMQSGGSMPTWNDTTGGSTTDGTGSWTCLGPIDPLGDGGVSNCALAIYDYMTESKSDYGMGINPSTIDISTVCAAANICDEANPVSSGTGRAPQYSCNGMFDCSSTRGNVFSALLSSMAGWAVPPGDLWRIYAGAWFGASWTLTEDDFRDTIKGDFRLSLRDVCNCVRGTFWTLPPAPPGGTLKPWQQTDFPPYESDGLDGRPNYIASEDGGQIIWKDIKLDFTTDFYMAQRLAKITLMRLRLQQSLTLPCKLTAFPISAGDVIFVNYARWGFNLATFQVIQTTIVCDKRGNTPALGIDLVVRQVSAAIYGFNATEYSPYNSTGSY